MSSIVILGRNLNSLSNKELSATREHASPDLLPVKTYGTLTLLTFSKVLTNSKTVVPIPVPIFKFIYLDES